MTTDPVRRYFRLQARGAANAPSCRKIDMTDKNQTRRAAHGRPPTFGTLFAAMPEEMTMRPMKTLFAALAAMIALSGGAMAMDAGQSDAFLPVRKAATAPAGASALCRTYDWACAGKTSAAAVGADVLKVAAQINRAANSAIRPISDMDQYATAERWTLPTKRGGDCEDYALFKKMQLIQAGISADRLLVAAVLDKKNNPHAVLVLRTDMGDFVLDNLTSRVLPWNKTGYAFLRMQNPARPSEWVGTYAQAGAGLSS